MHIPENIKTYIINTLISDGQYKGASLDRIIGRVSLDLKRHISRGDGEDLALYEMKIVNLSTPLAQKIFNKLNSENQSPV